MGVQKADAEVESDKREKGERVKPAPTKEEIDRMKQICVVQANTAKTRKKASVWKLVYLIIDLFSETGIRLSELVGQRPKVAFCRCKQCRAWRLHKEGKTVPEIVTGLKLQGIGSRQVEDLIELANADGEHSRQPLPGLKVKDIDFDGNSIRIYGKGWASGRHPIEDQPIESSELMKRLKSYIAFKKLKLEDKLVPLSARRVEQLVNNVAKMAGIKDAKFMSPHGFRRSYITDVISTPAFYGSPGQALVAGKRAARHVLITTTEGYVDLRKEDLRKAIRAGLARDKEGAAK